MKSDSDSEQHNQAAGSVKSVVAAANILPPDYLWSGLRAITRAEEIRNAVLIIFSSDIRGRIGIFCNRYISGAVTDQPAKTGIEAIQTLLSVKSGIYAIRACVSSESAELKQELALDIKEILALVADGGRGTTPADVIADCLPGVQSKQMMETGSRQTQSQTAGDLHQPQALSAPDASAEHVAQSSLLNSSADLPGGISDRHRLDSSLTATNDRQRLHDELERISKYLEASPPSTKQKSAADLQLRQDLEFFNQFLAGEKARLWTAGDKDSLPAPPPAQDAALPGDSASTAARSSEIGLNLNKDGADLVSDSFKTTKLNPKLFLQRSLHDEDLARRFKLWNYASISELLHKYRHWIVGVACLLITIFVIVYLKSQQDVAIRTGMQKLDQGDAQAAISDFSEAIEGSADNGRLYFCRALAEVQSDQENLAAADINNALSLGESKPHMNELQALLEAQSRQYELAIEHCNTIILDDPANLAAYKLRARCHLHKFEFLNARDDLTKAIQLCKNTAASAGLLTERALVEAELDDWSAAANDLSRVIEIHPGELAFMRRGDAYRAGNEFDKAIADYSTVIKLNPASYDAFVGRGICAVQLKHTQPAMSDFTQALHLNSIGVEALIQRGKLYMAEGKLQASMQDFQSAADINPYIEESQDNLSAVWRHLRIARHLPPLAPADSELPTDTKELFDLGCRKLQKKSYHDAMLCFREAVIRDPHNCPARKYLAHAYLQLDNPQAALDQLQALYALQPLDEEDTRMLAHCLSLYGQTEKAITLLANFLKHQPDCLPVKADLARLYFSQSDWQKGTQLCDEGIAKARSREDWQRFDEVMHAAYLQYHHASQ